MKFKNQFINTKIIKNKINKLLKHFNDHPLKNKSFLNSENKFQKCLAVILSARTKDSIVNKNTQELFKIVKIPSDFLKLKKEKIKNLLKKIYMHEKKIQTMKRFSDFMFKKNTINFNSLIKIKGIGIKTASIILNILNNDISRMIVDTHVYKFSKKILNLNFNINQINIILNQILKTYNKPFVSKIIILHGRTCKYKKNCIFLK